MAFIHEGSCEGTKTVLDLFSIPPTQTSMEHGSWIEYHPLTAVRDGGPIEFEISGSGEDYIDFANSVLSHRAGGQHKYAIKQRKNTIIQHNHKLSSAWTLWR